jgi:hypothetical protein
MAACAAQNFTNVNQAVWDCLVQQAQQYGVPIGGPQGCQTAHGFTVCWNWNSGAQTLMVQCTDSPWWAPCGMINGRIHDAVVGCGAQQNVVLTGTE